ncbi:PLxRFG domain-containing protein [Luteimonas saliphila]|uniref:PLxRFG domain-containing protein n=1 Tax=Luteimonas saliphila TaxID=2804919 RepID=UPI00192DB788|nr:PLxRFG domain-containing protein [Luteimonas saliphila]
MAEPWKDFAGAPAADGPWSEFSAPNAAPPQPAAPIQRPKSSAVRRVLGDSAVDIGRGVVGVGEAVAGLSNLATGGNTGKLMDAVGFDPETAKGMIGELYSPERKEAQQRVQEAEGFVGTAKAMIQNPSTIAGTVVESLPSMLGGGAIGQAVRRVVPAVGGIAAGAIGEGTIGAGQSAESIRQQSQDGDLTARQMAAAVGSGIGTAAFGAAGGGLARKLGIADVDVLAAGGGAPLIQRPGSTAMRAARGTAAGAVSEGVFEELPQSIQEQAWQNFALDRPLGEGVPEAAATGLLAGGAMGGPVGGFSAAIARPQIPVPGTLEDAARAVEDPAAASAAQGQPLALPAPVIRVRPDGKAAHESEIFRRQQLKDERAQAVDADLVSSRADMGLTPDVNAARAQHPAAAPNAPTAPRYPIARPGSLSDAANTMPDMPAAAAPAPAPAPLPRSDETGNAAFEERDVSTGEDTDLGAPTPINLDQETGEELGIDAERWPLAADHQQPAAIVRALKAQAAQNKNKPAGVTAIASTFNVSKDTARALRNRALDEMNAAAGNSRRLGAPAATGSDASPAADAAAAPSDADAQPAAPAALATAPADREAAAGGGEGGALAQAPGVSAADATSAQGEQPVQAPTARPELGRAAAEQGPAPPSLQEAPAAAGEIESTPAEQAPTAQARAAPPPPGTLASEGQTSQSPAAVSGASAQATPVADAAQTEADALVEVKDRYGVTHRVRQADLSGDRQNLRLYNKNGTRKTGPNAVIVRGNIDTTGEQRTQQLAAEADNPLFEVVTNRDGGAFKTEAAAKAYATKQGHADTHDVSPLGDDRGFVLRRKPAAAPAEQIAARANEAATSPKNDLPTPTDGQEAGNYRKGHVRLNGHDISIENPAGSRRNPDWPPLKDHYGYIKGTVGRDKDHVDVFMTENAQDPARPVFIVDQVNKDGSFDEHKVVMGAADEAEARATYQRNYSKGWTGLGGIKQMSQDEFKAWVRDPKLTRKPAGKLTKPAGAHKATSVEGRTEPKLDAPKRQLVNEGPNGIRVGERVVVQDDRRGQYEATVMEIEANAAPVYQGTAFKVAQDDAKPDGRGTGWVGIHRVSRAPAKGTTLEVARPPLSVRMDGNEYPVDSYEDASAKFRELRSAVDVGGMSVVELIDQAGRAVGWIGPKGEVYEGNIAEWRNRRDDPTPVYTPPAGAALPDPNVIEGQAARVEPEQAASEDTQRYRALATDLAGNPDYYNADLAKELFPEYNASNEARRDNNEKVGSQASKIAFNAFAERLKEAPVDGERVVVLMAGGTSSGKSTMRPERGIVYDSTMYDAASAKRNIDLVLASGRGVRYRFVFREPVDAFRESIKRGQGIGRFVNLTAFTRTHEGAYKAIQELQKQYAGDSRVDFILYDNTARAGRKVDALPVQEYNGLKEKLHEILDTEYAEGRIDEAEYRAVARAEPPARAEVRALEADPGRGRDAPAEGGPEQGQGVLDPAASPAGEAAASTATEDAGQELWYNRRNRTGAGLQWSDVEGLNDTLKVKEVVKSKVWPRPDYEQLIADGLRPEFAHLVKQVYDKLATKPQVRGVPTDQQLQAYIDTVAKVRDAVFDFVRDSEKVGAALNAVVARAAAMTGRTVAITSMVKQDATLLDAVFPMPDGSSSRWRTAGSTNENNAAANLVGGNRLVGALQLGIDEFSAAIKAVGEGWPTPQEAWQRIYKIRQYGSGFAVARAGRTIERDLPTREAAEATAKAHYEQSRKAGDTTMAVEARAVEQAKRVGPAHRRPDEDITSERLMEAFGFRGVNFGNWMKGESAAKRRERQLHLNHAYDALLDLSEITGLPPKAISLEGKLGLAFGAQGSGGRGAAHFVPGVNEINLTRTNGAGGIAHEWAHALDHYFAVQAGEAAARAERPYLTQVSKDTRAELGVRPEIARAVRSIVNSMEKRPQTAEEIAERQERADKQIRAGLNRALETLRKQIPESDAEALANFDDLAARLRAGDQGEGHVPTGRKVKGLKPRTRVDEEVSQVAGQMLGLLREHGAAMDYMLPNLLEADGRAGLLAYQAQQAAQREDHVPQTGEVRSEYLKEAVALESKSAQRGTGERYWTTPWELFARAFESYVIDRLASGKRRSDYLTWPQPSEAAAKALKEAGLLKGDQYPRGAERQRINEGFDTLLGEIKTEDTAEGQVRLFSMAAGAEAGTLTFDRAMKVKAELTGKWGDNAPNVVLVEDAEGFPEFAKVDPDYRRGEGVWGGRQTIWVNVGAIATERRLAEVLAHEAVGHYGVESILDPEQWTGIVSSIGNHDRNGTGAESLKRAMRSVHQRYGQLDPETFARETIAVMAEQGAQNGLLARVVAAVRAYLRKIMPSLKWTDGDVRALLGAADSFLRAGRPQAESRAATAALAFSQPPAQVQMDGRGDRRIELGGETFLEVGRRFYMVNGTGRPKDFTNLGAATEAAARTGGQVVLNDPIEGERPSWSVAVPETVARAAGAERPLFSKAPAEVLEDIDAVMAESHREGLLERAKQFLKDATPKKIKDELRGTWLGALTTRHLTELGADYFQNIQHYSDFLARQQADRNTLATEAEAIAEGARKWAGKHRAEARRLFDLMHQATIDGVDPAEGYKPLSFQYGGQVYEATQKNVKDALRAIREQMLGRGGDNKKDMLAEAKRIREMPSRERVRRTKYPTLVERWNELSPEAKAIYRQFRDSYAERSDEVEKALVARINDTDAPENLKRKLINTIRMQFETQRLQGVYFPLSRDGRYFVAAEKGDSNTFLMFRSLSALDRAVKNLKGRGFRITAQGMKAKGKAKDAPSGSFVADVIEQLRKAGVSDTTQDQIYQIYLQTLPELSMRKHSIHRKVVPGFDPDAVRAYAHAMHHGSHQLARLRWGHKMQNVLDLLKRQQDAARREEGADTRKIAAGDAIIEELNKRDEWINNPQDSNTTNLVSSFGFAWYLGATPAAALVNLSQTGMVSYPWLAARYGAVKSMNELLRAGAAAVRTVGNIQNTLTDPVERQAHAVLQQMGAIDKTQAHNLAGIAEGGMVGYNPKWAKAMEIIGWGFHKTEVVNREATSMAAFRLARAAGESFEQAIKTAADAIYDTHFDYSNANRARFMQSGTAKVLLMFRQYSLNMTWFLARTTWQATKGQDPEVRKIARRNLAGVLGMASIFAGVLGLPMVKLSMGVLNAVAASFGGDDEPWDAETEFRAWLSDMLGREAAEVVLTGPTNAATGADIHSRVSLSELWFRDADRELDGRGYYYHLLEQAAGPMGGVLKNVLVGKGMIDEGHVWRGVETMLPKSLKDMMKAARYGREGVNNLRGDPLLAEPSLWQSLLQLQGFTPAKVAQQYETNRSLKNYEQHILDRRQHLMNALAMAYRLNDPESRAETMEAIGKFNRTHPEIGITPASIRRSMQSRARYSAKAEAGIVLNPKIAAKIRAQVGVE